MKTTKIKNMKRYVSILCIAITLAACEKPEHATNNFDSSNHSTDQNDEISKLKSFLANAFHTKEDKVTYADEMFTIDGDMCTSLEDTRMRYKKSATRQRAAYLVSRAYASNIKIYVSTPASWAIPIDVAIAAWNKTDCLIKFSVTPNLSEANVVIKTTLVSDFPFGVAALTSLPVDDGKPGKLIRLNPGYNTGIVLGTAGKTEVIAHELGHVVGLEHTDETNGVFIDGTAVSDPASTMNSRGHSYYPWEIWPGFTKYDIIAFGILYPNYPGTVRLLRYYNPRNGDHFYTTNPAEPGAAGFNFEVGAGYVFPTQKLGTIALRRYYNGNLHYYGTPDIKAPSGYTYEGVAGYVYFDSAPSGASPLYKYYSTDLGCLMTKDWNELGNGSGSYRYLGRNYVY
jgi:hypothetical protein